MSDVRDRLHQTYDWPIVPPAGSLLQMILVPIAARRANHRCLTGFCLEVKTHIRALLKTPTFTLITILTLAIGIGATTAVFGVANAVLFRDLPLHMKVTGDIQPALLLLLGTAGFVLIHLRCFRCGSGGPPGSAAAIADLRFSWSG